MHKLFSVLIAIACLNLSACATTMLSNTLPDETSHTETNILAKDQILALGQAVQNQQQQGLVFVGRDFNYLMTEGNTELLKLLKTIPAEQRSLINPTPLVLTMEDANHFSGFLKIQYNTRIEELSPQQKVQLKALGFRQNFDLAPNLQTATYPYIHVFFKGQLYQKLDHQKIQHSLAEPYPVVLQQETTTTTKHPFKRATRKVLYPLAMTFDVVTVYPLLIWSDLKGDFNK